MEVDVEQHSECCQCESTHTVSRHILEQHQHHNWHFRFSITVSLFPPSFTPRPSSHILCHLIWNLCHSIIYWSQTTIHLSKTVPFSSYIHFHIYTLMWVIVWVCVCSCERDDVVRTHTCTHARTSRANNFILMNNIAISSENFISLIRKFLLKYKCARVKRIQNAFSILRVLYDMFSF